LTDGLGKASTATKPKAPPDLFERKHGLAPPGGAPLEKTTQVALGRTRTEGVEAFGGHKLGESWDETTTGGRGAGAKKVKKNFAPQKKIHGPPWEKKKGKQ